LEKGGLSGLSGSVEYPIELILYIAVQLGAHQPFLGGEHIMIFRVTGPGGIKKPIFAMVHIKKYTSKG
jgi:hypothetical protein